MLALAASAALIGCGPTAYKITPVPAQEELQETVVLTEGGLFPTKIAQVEVDGLIVNSRKFSLWGEGENPVSLFAEKLDKAAADPSVKAVVLRINSPGGGVTASDLMYGEVLNFKKRTGRPVVAVLMDVAASGGFYVACSADEIVANPTTVTGSIGVIMQSVNFAGTMSKLGIAADAITSGKMKDAGSPLRPMKPEEREIFQKLVNQFYDRFVAVVAAGRSKKLTEAKVRELADGRVYSAQQALELGFVDHVGSLKASEPGQHPDTRGLVESRPAVPVSLGAGTIIRAPGGSAGLVHFTDAYDSTSRVAFSPRGASNAGMPHHPRTAARAEALGSLNWNRRICLLVFTGMEIGLSRHLAGRRLSGLRGVLWRRRRAADRGGRMVRGLPGLGLANPVNAPQATGHQHRRQP